MLQPQAAGQPDDRNKHKFMVQWVAVPNNYTDDVDNFVRKSNFEIISRLIFICVGLFQWKQDLKSLNVQDSKLKCVFSEEQPAAVVPNDPISLRESDAVS